MIKHLKHEEKIRCARSHDDHMPFCVASNDVWAPVITINVVRRRCDEDGGGYFPHVL